MLIEGIKSSVKLQKLIIIVDYINVKGAKFKSRLNYFKLNTLKDFIQLNPVSGWHITYLQYFM